MKNMQRLFLSQTYRKHFHESSFNEDFGASKNEMDLPLPAQEFLVGWSHLLRQMPPQTQLTVGTQPDLSLWENNND